MVTLKKGDKAPNFEGKDQFGNAIGLVDYQGKKLIFYFYPKDNTPGCTAESCNLRDHYQELEQLGLDVLGISSDNEDSHMKFVKKYNLPFKLVADTDKKIHEKYGTWGEKKMYGKTYFGTLRTTFIIDEKGDIIKVIKKVKTKEHVNQVLDLIKEEHC